MTKKVTRTFFALKAAIHKTLMWSHRDHWKIAKPALVEGFVVLVYLHSL